MKARAVVLALVLVAVSLTGCSSVIAGEPVTENRAVGEFTAVSIGGSGSLSITVGETASLSITAPQKTLDTISVTTLSGVLEIDTDHSGSAGDAPIIYMLTVPFVDGVIVRGSANVTADFTGASDVSIETRGSGSVTGTGLEADHAQTTVRGSGGIKIVGTVAMLSIVVTGSGDYEGPELESRECTVDVAGSGSAEVNVTKTLAIDLRGSGNVAHTGGAEVTSDIAGSGEVIEF